MKRWVVGAGLVMAALTATSVPVRAQEGSGTAAVAVPNGQDEYWGECARAIAAAEPASNLPQGLLLAIAMVESGRRNPDTRQVQPWPWSWNAGGESGFAETRGEAATAINALLEGGQRSIDVGCMQVNLLHHGDAFSHVEEALDPTTNVAYAIRFLHRLRARNGSWAQAVADYHSGTPWRGAAYHRRVVSAGRETGMEAGAVELPARTVSGLCAPGMSAALLLANPAAPRTTRGSRPVAGRGVSAPRTMGTARTRIICLPGRTIELAQATLPRPPMPTPPTPSVQRTAARTPPPRATQARGVDPALLPLPPTPARAAQARPSAPAGTQRYAPPYAPAYPTYPAPYRSYFVPPHALAYPPPGYARIIGK